MSKLLITKYHNQLHEILSAGGTRNETSITFAFANLLRSYAEKKGLLLVEQKDVIGRGGKRVIPDGTLKYFGGIDVGYWEAKDSKDKLDDEIHIKLSEKGYPNKNIIFEDTQTAVLIQEGAQVMRVPMNEWNLLDDLLDRFVDYQPSEVKEFSKALAQFKENVPDIVKGLRELMELEAEKNKNFREMRNLFLEIARSEINPEITPEDVREMIIQHILTEDIFTNVFGDAEFHRSNNIARELEDVIHTFMTREVRKNYLRQIENFYKTIRDAASGINDNREKQKFLKTVYENFYKVYNPKGADKLGVVYTPNEIVRFMIDSTDWLLEKHFGKSLSDKGVDILDPATGTGTFIAELIDRINIHNLEYKYEHELHANEVAILPYYIANLNIEYTYQQRKGIYKEFKNICFMDTLDNLGFKAKDDAYFGKYAHTANLFGISSENAKRIKDQNERKISVIIGNPPYNAKQANYNFQNSNRAYQVIDRRIKDTYIKHGTAQNQIVVYDMFTRFYRWSMDRLNDNGVIAFITNRTFIDSRAFDGFRKSVQNEFDSIYIVDLRSDVRANPKIAGTTHNVFGIQTGVAIAFLIKNSEKQKDKHKCKIHYIELDDFWRKEKKLEWIRENPISTIAFERIEHDAKNNWINQTDNDWDSLLPLVDKDVKAGKSEEAVFQLFSAGLQTKRDEWAHSLSKDELVKKISFLIKTYNENPIVNDAINTEIKWDERLKSVFDSGKKLKFENNSVVLSLYRPFVKQYLYFDNDLNSRVFQWREIYNSKVPNLAIGIPGVSANKPFHCLASNLIIGQDTIEKTQCIPLFHIDKNSNQKHENITDWGLTQFQTHYKESNGARITKQDIFYYTYAVLHSPDYRKKYEQNLKREFPRLPFYDDFFQWRDWGAALMDLHINYETQEPFPLERKDLDLSAKNKAKQNNLFAAAIETVVEVFTSKPKTKLRADKASGTIEIDSHTTLAGVPSLAWEYKLGNRSALEWILDQYKKKKPQDATIAERFNTYKFEDYKEQVIDLLKRVCTVSAKTMEIINKMPDK
ncbi:MAG: N-6 DNA methylase [Acidobacteria bacterium]|nr:N-6 DNA methylase [Acidobacteriota bacterium]MCA1636882.1 N-6 DNA methylase [Acidobacteriota bacterium]